jgi:hypothetical protein
MALGTGDNTQSARMARRNTNPGPRARNFTRSDPSEMLVPRLSLSGDILKLSSGAISTPTDYRNATFDGPLDLVLSAPQHNAPI